MKFGPGFRFDRNLKLETLMSPKISNFSPERFVIEMKLDWGFAILSLSLSLSDSLTFSFTPSLSNSLTYSLCFLFILFFVAYCLLVYLFFSSSLIYLFLSFSHTKVFLWYSLNSFLSLSVFSCCNALSYISDTHYISLKWIGIFLKDPQHWGKKNWDLLSIITNDFIWYRDTKKVFEPN